MNKFWKYLYVYIIVLASLGCSGKGALYDQYNIPLDNIKGVPFTIVMNDYNIEGFDVDENGDFFFLGGDNTVLVSYSMSGEELCRVNLKKFKQGPIHIVKNSLYVFDNKYDSNSLFELDKRDGKIVTEHLGLIDNRVNSVYFSDTSFFLEIFNYQNTIDLDTKVHFLEFDFESNFKSESTDRYGLPEFFKSIYANEYFIGKWENGYVFWDYDIDNEQYMYLMRDQFGKTISKNNLDENNFGKSFYGAPLEHFRIRGNYLYQLNRAGDNACITVIDLNELFSVRY